jgi:sphingosine kinase
LSFLVSDDFKDFKPKDSTIKVLKSADQNQNITRTEQDSDRKFKYLRPLDQQVPSDWLTIEENFVFFLIVSKPLIAPTFIAAPDSKLDDGNMHLIFIKEGITKFELVQLFDQTESGSHLNNPKVEYCKIKAFRLEPLVSESTEKNGVMMVDGEHVPYGMIQAEVAPGIARILSK